MLGVLLAAALHLGAGHHGWFPHGVGFGGLYGGYPTEIVSGVTYEVLPSGQLIAVPTTSGIGSPIGVGVGAHILGLGF